MIRVIKSVSINEVKNNTTIEGFEEAYNDDCKVILVSKETLEHIEDGLNFKYKYAITAEYLGNISDALDIRDKVLVTLDLVPTPSSLNSEIRRSLAEEWDWEGDTLDDEMYYYSNIVDGGYSVALRRLKITIPIEEDGTPLEEVYNLLNNVKVLDRLKALGNEYRAVDAMRGFYLDRCANYLGTNGWEFIKEYVNGDNAILATLDRLTTK